MSRRCAAVMPAVPERSCRVACPSGHGSGSGAGDSNSARAVDGAFRVEGEVLGRPLRETEEA